MDKKNNNYMKKTIYTKSSKETSSKIYFSNFLQKSLLTLFVSFFFLNGYGQDAAMGYNYETPAYYSQKLSIAPVNFNTGTTTEFNYSVSGISSIITTRVCGINIECYVFGSNSHYQEVSLATASSSQSIGTITFTGSSNNADTCKAAIVYSDQIPFSETSVLAAETVIFPSSSGTFAIWKKINGSIPAGTKSVRIYRQIYYGSGSISSSSGSGRLLYGSTNTLRLASIVTSTATTLPIKFSNTSAFRKGNNVSIEWSIADILNVTTFQIERSSNNLEYKTISTLNAQSNMHNYKWEDNTSLLDDYFYRIKAVEKNGDITYSNVLRVKTDKQQKSGISVYPNPIKNQQPTLKLNSISKGIYSISIYNVKGQEVYKLSLNHNGLDDSYKLNIPLNDKKGTFYLVLRNAENSFKQTLIFQ
jgi:hypothetical protein